jgi:hypothetical protein
MEDFELIKKEFPNNRVKVMFLINKFATLPIPQIIEHFGQEFSNRKIVITKIEFKVFCDNYSNDTYHQFTIDNHKKCVLSIQGNFIDLSLSNPGFILKSSGISSTAYVPADEIVIYPNKIVDAGHSLRFLYNQPAITTPTTVVKSFIRCIIEAYVGD